PRSDNRMRRGWAHVPYLLDGRGEQVEGVDARAFRDAGHLVHQPRLGAGGEDAVLSGTCALTVDRLTFAEMTGEIAGAHDLVRTRFADLQAHVAVIAPHPHQRDRHRCSHGW